MIYCSSLALCVDLYELTMAYGYWKLGMAEREAVFTLFFRRPPFQGGFAIAAGLGSAVDFIEQFKFNESDLSYLEGLKTGNGKPLFEVVFLNYLKTLKFTCDIEAVVEGTPIFPYEPIIRVQGPILQAQLLESSLLNIINFQTLIATKACRISMLTQGDEVVEFGLRRAQGMDGALSATRAAFVGGCHSTSNVLAGKLFGIPVKGTHSHSWVMAFDDERASFEAYSSVMPDECIFLVDTHDTIEGVKRAIAVARKHKGLRLLGVRIDSGDLVHLSVRVRKLLDDAGYRETKIMASNELDEMVIRDLKMGGARIDLWGIGTNLITGKGQGALDGVYKLTAIRDIDGRWCYKIKTSEQFIKTTNPGILQVGRFFGDDGGAICDMIYDVEMGFSDDVELIDSVDHLRRRKLDIGGGDIERQDLLVPLFRGGKRVYDSPDLFDIQRHTKLQMDRLPKPIYRFLYRQSYFVGLEQHLYALKMRLIAESK